MKIVFVYTTLGLLGSSLIAAQQASSGFVYETPEEFFSSGDFDGDGRADLVIVDKATGKFRVGYGSPTGTVSWVDCRITGVKPVTGFNVGKLLSGKNDALAFTTPEANKLTLVDASDASTPAKPVNIEFSAGLGTTTIVGLPGPGAANGLLDLYVGSTLNSPDPNMATLLRNDGSEFSKISDVTLPGGPARANRVEFKSGQRELLTLLIRGEKNDTLQLEDWSSGKQVVVASVADLPAGSEYLAGEFRGNGLKDFLFYKSGDSKLTVRPVAGAAGEKLQLGNAAVHDLGQPISSVVTLAADRPDRLFVIFGKGENGAVFSFDGTKAPSLVQTIIATNETLTSAVGVPGGLIAFSRTGGGNFSSKYYAYKNTGSAYAFSVFGTLPTLADNDNIIIPDLYASISAKQTVKSESEMKAYTNVIPGTQVSFAMAPIPGGEFTMGSPASEAGRKPDEGPQHKVKISPFWMQQCEVTWDQYELFMYPEEERRTRATEKTDSAADDLADAVTHPSRPYTEMSFGMGKDGYPAIAMTHHAANKFCQWLSAKTGEFYRLPTEAEWEYACRAGTKTAYFFGDDPKELGKYAWYDENSEFKYQKVMKKKPNPWGLYDIYGNVTEWVLDQYDPDYYKRVAQSVVSDPWNKATKPYPHSVRGGSWEDETPACRSATRRGSERNWKMTDPQLPKSVWYLSDATFVGFRFVRPLKVPTPAEMQRYWTSGTERD